MSLSAKSAHIAGRGTWTRDAASLELTQKANAAKSAYDKAHADLDAEFSRSGDVNAAKIRELKEKYRQAYAAYESAVRTARAAGDTSITMLP